MNTVFTEYINKNSLRNYPFEDTATLKSTTGYMIPPDFIVDICLYPFNAVGVPYISDIDLLTDKIIFKDSVNNSVLGYAVYDSDEEDIPIYDDDNYLRQIGVIILGEGKSKIKDGVKYEFLSGSTKLSATAYFLIPGYGVRGFILPDSTLVTGNVIFEGRNGINIKSYTLAADSYYPERKVIVFNIDGAILSIDESTTEDCIGVPVKSIEITTKKSSRIIASDYGNGNISITTRCDITQESLCPEKMIPGLDPNGNIKTYPANKRGDICTDPYDPTYVPDPCLEPADPDTVVSVVTVNPYAGKINYITPSTVAASNPVKIKVELPKPIEPTQDNNDYLIRPIASSGANRGIYKTPNLGYQIELSMKRAGWSAYKW